MRNGVAAPVLADDDGTDRDDDDNYHHHDHADDLTTIIPFYSDSIPFNSSDPQNLCTQMVLNHETLLSHLLTARNNDAAVAAELIKQTLTGLIEVSTQYVHDRRFDKL